MRLSLPGEISYPGRFRGWNKKQWPRMMDDNLNAVFHADQTGLPLLRENAPFFLLGKTSERLQLPVSPLMLRRKLEKGSPV